MSPREELAKNIFLNALEIESTDELEQFLREQCGDDDGLRREVEDLLLFEARRKKMFPSPEGSSDPSSAETVNCASPEVDTDDIPIARARQAGRDSVAEKPGMMVGRYKLLQQIGEGGFGVVYMAEQEEPVKRRVALKVIKAGMDTKAVIARFEAERQALAMMDHPNIARVLDAGATDTGRPYFVMELVKGIPITDYCDKANLDTRLRLDLFKDVCSAVQHAHQKGIIHRDLKPSNIMVTLRDDKPNVKVIDFGIAKATQQKLTEKTLFTNYGQMIGTPTYMSPEQAVLSEFDVDTRSDVYSLGVLLYELLTGSPPFDAQTLRSAGFDEMRRIIREQEPPKPSTKLSTLAEDARLTIAAKRHMSPAALSRQLHGDLDWIVMKALEKDRTRRYESASAFAQDIERHINAEPVSAAAPSVGYRFRKFARRNRGPMTVAAVIALLLVGGTVISTLLAIRAMSAEELAGKRLVAVQREKMKVEEAAAKERAANEQAQKRLTQIEKGNEIITSIFADLDIRQVREGTEPLEAVLAKRLVNAANQLEGETAGDPLAVAKMQVRLGVSLASLGYPQESLDLFAKARATFEATPGVDDVYTLTCMNNLALAYSDTGHLDLALPLLEETLKRARVSFGPEHRSTIIGAGNLASAYQAAGKLDLALPLLEETLKFSRLKLGIDHPVTLTNMNNLAGIYQEAGKLVLALPLYEESLKLSKEILGPDHPTTLTSMNNLAIAYRDAGMLDRAQPLMEETLRLQKAKLGADHPDTLISMNNLAAVYRRTGNLDRALPLLEETLRCRKEKFGTDHSATLASINNLALAYQAAGKVDLAVPLFEEALRGQRKIRGADHPRTLTCMNNLAVAYQTTGKLDLAVSLLEETLKLSSATLGANHPDTLITMNNLASAYSDTNRLDLAIPLYEKTLNIRRMKFAADDPATLTCMSHLGDAYISAGKLDLALPLIEETLKLMKAKLGHDDPATLTSMCNLATCYQAVGKLDQALPLYEEAYKAMKATLGADHPYTITTMDHLALAYVLAGKPELAAPLSKERLAISKLNVPPGSTQLASSLAMTGLILLKAKSFAEAEPLCRQSLSIREKAMPDHWLTFNTQSMLGHALLGQKKYAEAEPLLIAGYEGMKQREASIPAQGEIRLTEALQRLVTLHEQRKAPGDAAKAINYRKLLAERKAAETPSTPRVEDE